MVACHGMRDHILMKEMEILASKTLFAIERFRMMKLLAILQAGKTMIKKSSS